jgi:hypothetical protein
MRSFCILCLVASYVLGDGHPVDDFRCNPPVGRELFAGINYEAGFPTIDFSENGWTCAKSGVTFDEDGGPEGQPAYDYDANGEYVRIEAAGSPTTKNLTICVWMYNDTSGGFAFACVKQYHYTSSPGRDWYQDGTVASSGYRFQLGTSNGWGYKNFSDTPNLNEWVFVVLVYDTTESTGADRIRLYENNVRKTAYSSKTDPTLNSDITLKSAVHAYLGARANAGTVDYSMRGLHCGGRLYTRALSDAEITDLYAQGRPK